MKPAAFRYAAAQTVTDAVTYLAQYGPGAKVLAGGQSLVPLMNMRLAEPDVIVDINGVAELNFVTVQDDKVVVGACVRQRDLELNRAALEALPLLAKTIRYIGHPQIRNQGTVVGSIVHADPSAELPAVLSALGGAVKARSAKGERLIPADDLFITYFTTSLEPDELAVEAHFPIWTGQVGSAFEEVSRRHGDFALVGVAAQVALEAANVSRGSIALIGVGDRPVKADLDELLVGKQPTRQRIAEVAAAIADRLEPESDLHASREYRIGVARTLTERTLQAAIEDAGGTVA